MPERAFNAADPEAVRDRKRTAKDALELQREDLKALLKQPEFRRYVWRLIGSRCKLLETPHSSNGSLQSVNIGRQDVGRELWSEIESVDAFAIPQMMVEHAQEMLK